jgi:phage recombination protein Bet
MSEQQLAKKPQLSYTKDQVELVKSQIAPEATVDELKLFLYQAQRTGLDALSRQIYCIHRNVKTQNGWSKKMTIQTSIDGFRVIAERSGNYGGQSEPIITYKENGEIESCKLTVYKFRGDIRYDAATSVVYWDEYVQRDKEGKPMGLWSKMGRVMIQKVCEAVCLRKAFPQDLSGLYTGDEMAQSTDETPAYIKAHDSVDDLELAIDLCVNTTELSQLYALNNDIVEREVAKEVTKLFTKKKQTL